MRENYVKNFARLLLLSSICLLLNGCVISRRVENDKAVIKQEEISNDKVENASIGEITINYNDKHTVLKAILGGENSCLMLPGKELAEFLGLFTDWDPESNILGISDGNTPTAVQEGNVKANINNKMKLLEAAPVVQEGQLFVPVSFISDTYGFYVDLDSAAATLTITMDADNVNMPSADKTADAADNEASNEANDEATGEGSGGAEDKTGVVNSPIVGFWSTLESFQGDIIDLQTGITSGQYSGEWYLFNEDGTFQSIVIGSGLIISGSAIQRGNFSVEGNKVKLYNTKESWYPDISRSDQKKSFIDKPIGDQEGVFSIEDEGKTLRIDFGVSTRLSKVVR